MANANDDGIDGRLQGDQPDPDTADGLLVRLFYMILIWVMLSFTQTIVAVLTVMQFVIMLVNKGAPNERLAEFGTDLGIWIAKAVRYQTAASEVKPWPWTELD